MFNPLNFSFDLISKIFNFKYFFLAQNLGWANLRTKVSKVTKVNYVIILF